MCSDGRWFGGRARAESGRRAGGSGWSGRRQSLPGVSGVGHQAGGQRGTTPAAHSTTHHTQLVVTAGNLSDKPSSIAFLEGI